MSSEKRYPIEDCKACHYTYWACKCGDSPINGYGSTLESSPPRPARCRNQYCHTPTELRLVEAVRCCQSYNHHLGGQCSHCGERD